MNARRVVWLALGLGAVALSVRWIATRYQAWLLQPGYEFVLNNVFYPASDAVNKWEPLGRASLPVHLACGPVALLGGMFQFSLGLDGKGATKLHRNMGWLVNIAMTLGLVSSVGLLLASVVPHGWLQCAQLSLLALYTGVNLALGIHFILRKQVLKHKEFMFRCLIGWFNFVTYRIVNSIRESRWDTAASVVGTFMLTEVIVHQLRKEQWWINRHATVATPAMSMKVAKAA
ncbi:hypothetical protein ACHAXT_005718 [Thalassiosira profunda]